MDLLDHHRPYRPDCNGKALSAPVGRALCVCHLDRSGEIPRQARDDIIALGMTKWGEGIKYEVNNLLIWCGKAKIILKSVAKLSLIQKLFVILPR